MSEQLFPTHLPASHDASPSLARAGWHLRAAVQALREGARDALRRNRTRNHLLELDDRLLRDIGLTPTDAAREARKPFWRP